MSRGGNIAQYLPKLQEILGSVCTTLKTKGRKKSWTSYLPFLGFPELNILNKTNNRKKTGPGEMTELLLVVSSCRRPGFYSQHPCDGSQSSVTLVPWDSVLSSGFCGHIVYIHIKNKINLEKNNNKIYGCWKVDGQYYNRVPMSALCCSL